MTGPGRPERGGVGQGLDGPPISVLDAVCCVYFCAAGKGKLLTDVLTALGMEILVPAEVAGEVLRKRNFGSLSTQWPRMAASTRVRVLAPLVVGESPPGLVAHVARIRGLGAAAALTTSKDLGEAVVLGHATFLAEQGHDVYVVIDDRGGQVLAEREPVSILTVEDLLLAAVEARLLPGSDLRKTYEQFRHYGSGLPSWNASDLKRRYDQRSRQQHDE